MKAHNHILLAVFFFTFCSAAFAQKSFEAYPLGNNDGPALLEAAKALVGPEGAVVLDRKSNRLLVIAETEQHKLLADMFSKVPAFGKNVFIEVRFTNTGRTKDAGASVGAEGKISSQGSKIVIKPQIHHMTTETGGETVQSIMAASGSRARIQVGTSVPMMEWFIDYGWRWGIIHERMHWNDVGAFLSVEPTIIGDGPEIKLVVTPELSGLDYDKPCCVQFTKASLEVLVQNGIPVSIGGLEKDEEFYSRFLVGGISSDNFYTMDITLTAWITDAAGRRVPAE
ncbi:MAG: hypothetical protein AB7T27_09805 [Kiritimatiellia bacterium]